MNSSLSKVDKTAIKKALNWAFDSALIVRHSSPDVLRLEGSSSLDLLNRMSTNELLNMPINSIRETVLTSAHARIIDRIHVIHQTNEVLLLTSRGRGENVLNWLRQHIFFQDDVQISLMPSDWSFWGVYGPDADKVISVYFPEADIPEFNRILASNGAIIWRSTRPIPGIQLLVDRAYGNEIENKLSASEGIRSNEHAYEIIRIKAGFPHSPNEINENYIPLEIDLWDAVSFSKGCYVGQEIIARLESRGKLARKLVGLQLSGHAPLDSPIFHGKRNLGALTSITFSPDEEWIGLAVIKTIPGDASEATFLLGNTQVEGKIFQFV